MATLKELKKEYTFEESWILWEAVVIPRYNDFLANKQAESKMKRS